MKIHYECVHGCTYILNMYMYISIGGYLYIWIGIYLYVVTLRICVALCIYIYMHIYTSLNVNKKCLIISTEYTYIRCVCASANTYICCRQEIHRSHLDHIFGINPSLKSTRSPQIDSFLHVVDQSSRDQKIHLFCLLALVKHTILLGINDVGQGRGANLRDRW